VSDRPAIIIAGCGKAKLPRSAPARELYTGSLAAPRIAYVAHRADELGVPWWIFSAAHGLVHPDTVLEPYDTTLTAMRAAGRRAVAGRVIEALEEVVEEGALIEIHAGAAYRDALDRRGAWRWRWSVPLRGLMIGEQIRWYRERLRRGQ